MEIAHLAPDIATVSDGYGKVADCPDVSAVKDIVDRKKESVFHYRRQGIHPLEIPDPPVYVGP